MTFVIIIAVILLIIFLALVYQGIKLVAEIIAYLTTALHINYIIGLGAAAYFYFYLSSVSQIYILVSIAVLVLSVKMAYNHMKVRCGNYTKEDFEYSKTVFRSSIRDVWSYIYAFAISVVFLITTQNFFFSLNVSEDTFQLLEAIAYLLKLKLVFYSMYLLPLIFFIKGYKESGTLVILKKPPVKKVERSKIAKYFDVVIPDLKLPDNATIDVAKTSLARYFHDKQDHLSLSDLEIDSLVQELIFLSFNDEKNMDKIELAIKNAGLNNDVVTNLKSYIKI